MSSMKLLNEIMATHTGRSVKQVEKDSDRDKFMSADEAKEYGIVDVVLRPKKPGEKDEKDKQDKDKKDK